ncbi:uncharacterized protein LOC117111546 isoform X2 [Anneissia japonica]|nr:uncharacterized protein LOC117111546 isoform X2 [Anneissia japonica]
MVKTVGASAIRHRKRFLQQLQETAAMQDQWTQYAAELTKEHRTLSKSIRGLEQKLQDQYDKANHLAKARGSPPPVRRRQSGECFEGEPEIQAIQRTKKVHKIRELWKAVDDLHTTQKPERDVLQSIVEGAANRFKLDASDINVHIPELLLRDCEKELQRRNLANTYEGGKLNLLTLIHLWNLSLHLYLEQLNQVSLPDFGELAPAVVTQVHNQHTHLANTHTLRSTLSNELLPQLKESIAMLKEELELQGDSTLRQTDSLSSSRNKFHDLTLLPSTPPVSFQPDTNMRGGTPQEITGKPLQKSPDIMNTPEAASLLRSVIDKAALRRTAIAQGTPFSTNRNLKYMGSKLPRPTTTVGSDVVEDRKRIKSAPSRSQCTSTASCEPLRHPKTTKKASNGSYIHHQIGNQTVEDKANKDHVKDHVKERSDVKKTDTKKKFKPKRNHHHKLSSAVKATTKANGSDTSALRDINTLAVIDIGTPAVKDLGTPAVSDTRTPAVSSINKPKSTAKVTTAAHTLLADQIADAVAGSFVDGNTPSPNSQPLALDDPLAALHQTAFMTRDKLNRTPERKTAKENGEERVSTSKSSQMPTKNLFDEDWLASPPGYQDIVVSEFKEEQSVIKETYEKSSNAGLSAKNHQKTDIKPEDNSEPKVMREDYSNSDYSTQHAYHIKLDLELQASDSPVIGTPEGLYKDLQSDLSEIFASKTPSLPLRSRQYLKARKDNFVDSPIVESMRTSVAMKTSLSTGIEMPVDGLGSPNGDISAGFTLDDLLKETWLSVESGSSEISGESMAKSALKARNGSDDSQKSVHFSSGYQENIFQEEANSSSDRSLAENAKTKHENLDEDLDQFSGSVHSLRNRLSGMFSEDESFDLDISRPVEELLHYISPATTPTHLESHGGVRLSSHPTDSPFDISKHDATVSLLERLKLTSVSSDNASPQDTQMRKEMSDRNQQEFVNTMDFHDDFCADKVLNLQREDDCELSKSTVTRSTSNFDLLDESDDSILMPSSPMLGNDYSPIDQMASPLEDNVHPSIIPPSPAVGQLIDI